MQRPPYIILKSMKVFTSLNAGFKGLENSKALESLMRDVLGFLRTTVKERDSVCSRLFDPEVDAIVFIKNYFQRINKCNVRNRFLY